MQRFLRENSLSLAMFGLFAVTLVGQAITGWSDAAGWSPESTARR